ncbi:hypothetical protein J4E80_008952 [Alternaria sp. BMP 0032]|nr:hypothetical protein J4E80_008952 [Alternaria sp. BMP 0032]
MRRSWAPRWDDEAVAPPLGVPEAECPWSACGERRAVMANEISCPPEQLYLQGVVYSRVYEVGDIMDFYNLKDPDYVYDPKFTENPEDDDENIPDPQDIYAISDPTERHPFIKAFKKADVEAAPERFARTLTRGCSQYDVEEYLQDLGDSVQIRHHDACYHALQRLLSLQEFGTEGNFAHNNDSTQFEKEAYYACQQRRMFWTEKSSYGLGPQCMQTGDMVVVLYGGNTPYVLRPRGNEYIFMGQAYVDEIMNGEVFQDSTSDIPKEQTFCLI